MNSTRTRDGVLTAVGFAGWLLYILACTSFSPDDSKVVFPSNDPATGASALAVYDRTTRTTRTLLAFPAGQKEDDQRVLLRGAWTPDGTRVVALWAEKDDALRVLVASLDGKEPTRLLVADIGNDGPPAVLVGPPVVGSHLFVGDKKRIVRLDLRSGEAKERAAEGEPILAGQQDRVYYRRKVAVAAAGQAEQDQVEVGLVDAQTLALTPLFKTPEAGEGGFLAVARDGTRIALGTEKDKVPQILIFQNRQLLRTIPIGTTENKIHAGNFQWSPDGSVLYCMTVKSLGDDQHHQFSVLELSPTGGPAREIPLLVMTGALDDMDIFAFQLDVSHDGRTLAAASTYLQSPLPKPSFGSKDEKPVPPRARLKPEDVALFLVDLSGADRKVTRVPLPTATSR